MAVPTATRRPTPHSALRRLVAHHPVAAFLVMVYTVNTAVALMPVLTDPAAADTLLAELEHDIESALSDVRRLVYDLRPPALDELGLVEAVREAAAQYGVNGVSISIRAPERLPLLPAAVEVAAYRIVQEALTNVVRHAGADYCLVRLSLNEVLELEITDDGVGLPADRRAGVGLSSMLERAAELGGTCVIEPAPSGGAAGPAAATGARQTNQRCSGG